MNAKFYKIKKKPYSTLVPDVNSGITLTIELKEQTSIINPQITVYKSTLTDVDKYNYVYIAKFSRYYFIRNWHWLNGIWLADCEVDVLASYRDDIRGSTQYVLRSSSSFDGRIIDTLYPTDTEIDPLINNATVRGAFATIADGCYILGVIGNDEYAIGGISYYVLTQDQFRELNSTLLSSTPSSWIGAIQEISENLLKALFDPYQYIASCIWYPFTLTSGTETTLKLGYWDTDITVKRIPSATVTSEFTIDLPNHPQIARGRYLNCAPFTEYLFAMSPYGVIPISPNGDLYSENMTLKGEEIIDLITGTGTLNLRISSPVSTGFPIYKGVFHTILGVPINLSSTVHNQIPAAVQAGNVLPNLATGNLIGAIGAGISAIGSALGSIAGDVGSRGSNGSFADLLAIYPGRAYVAGLFRHVVDEDNAHRGRPLCQAVQLSTLSGYCMAADPHIEIWGTIAEAEEIIADMKRGIYLE